MRRTIAILVLVTACLGLPATAAAKTCEISITGNDQMKFNKSELVVGADCDTVELTLEHVGEMSVEQMGHNWVLTETGDYKSVAQAGMKAGMENEYIPQGDDRVIASTSLVGGGDSTSVSFDVSGLEPGGDYTFVCSFPGHYGIMNGEFVIEG